jgi:outer membrane autotransporter protein
LFLESMRQTAPLILARLGLAGVGIGQTAASSVAGQLQAIRRAGTPGWASGGPSVWTGGRLDFGTATLDPDSNSERTIAAGTVGFDYAWKEIRAGLAATVQGGRFGNGDTGIFNVAPSVTPTLYAGYFGDRYYGYGSVGYTPGVRFTDIKRPAAYGLTGIGETKADIWAFDGEAGVKFPVNGITATPFVGLTHIIAKLHGYTEDGAAGGNVVYPDNTATATILRVGGEVSATIRQLTPSIRAAYNHVLNSDTQLLDVKLDQVLSPMATQTVSVQRFNGHSVTIGVGLQGDISPTIGWRVGYDASIATRDSAVAHGVTAGIRVGL